MLFIKRSCFCIGTVLMLSGCATSLKLIETAGVTSRNDVFQVISGTGLEATKGKSALHLTASFKKPVSDGLLSKEATGSKSVAMLVNIDGQSLRVADVITEEERDSVGLRDPEAGKGFMHAYSSDLLLEEGRHHLIVAFPDLGLALARDVELASDAASSIVIKPVYDPLPGRPSLANYGVTSYREGIRRFNIIFNGKQI